MDTNSVWEFLSSLKIGTVIAWFIVIATIIAVLCTGTINLYKLFLKYKGMKDKNKKQKELIESHEAALCKINESLNEIKKSLDEQKKVNFKQLRHSIVYTCDEALSARKISGEKLESLEEMYEDYVKIFHKNGYVTTMMNKVRKVPVKGRLEK